MASVTPMMQQYLDTKAEYKDCILFFRLGDFYEMFFDDARTASRELELTLTGKDCGLSERAPMCGVPYHAVDTYVEKLIERGYKVAICEQMEDPALAKGLVKRAVTRIITPGTVIEPAMLDEKANNFLLSICFVADRAGLAFADVSTGEFYVHEITQPETTLSDEVARISPMEIICNDQVKLRACLQREMQNASEQPSAWFQLANATEALCRHFALNDLSPLGLSDEYKAGASAAGALMRYLSETQKNALEHMTSLRIYQGSETMLLDRNTRRNLELTESIRGRSRKGSLLWLLDKTSTAMGGRLLRSWIEQPLVDEAKINRRLDAVGEFAQEHVLTMTLAEELQGVYDIERLLSKVAYKSMNARDCLSLCASLQKVPKIRELLREAKSQAVEEIRDSLDTLPELTEGQSFSVMANVSEHFTSPPKAYTEDTLLSAMERAGAEDMPEDKVNCSAGAREGGLGHAERKGLGTPATRAAILEKLVQMGFVQRKGKQLVPTKDGINLAVVLPESLTSPALTAEWESRLTEIAKGNADADEFMAEIEAQVRQLVKTYSCISADKQNLFQSERVIIGKCPRCSENVYEGKKNFYCGNRSCQFVMWKNDRFFEQRKKAFTPKIAAALLKNGKAKVKGLYSEKTGKTYDATVLLADTGGKYVNYRVERKE